MDTYEEIKNAVFIHRDATKDDLSDLPQIANSTPNAYVIITGKITVLQAEIVRQLGPHVKWRISKKSYEEVINEIKQPFGMGSM